MNSFCLKHFNAINFRRYLSYFKYVTFLLRLFENEDEQ